MGLNMSDLSKQTRRFLAIWFAGGMPLAFTLAWSLKLLFELQGYGITMAAMFGLFCVLPVAALTLGIAIFFLMRQRTHQLVTAALLMTPSLIVLVIGFPLLNLLWKEEASQRHEAMRIDYERNAPGPVSFVELGSNAQRNFEEQVHSSYILEAADGATAPHYEGYQLLSGNRLNLKSAVTQDSITQALYALTPPDYTRLDTLVRRPGAPVGAWLWPQQIETVVLIFDNHAEAVAIIRDIDDSQKAYATQISLSNYTGQNISRVRINGWDLLPEIQHAEFCSSTLNSWIPELLSTSLSIQWQVVGETGWHQQNLTELPPEAVPSPGQVRVGQTLNLILGYQNDVALRRDLTVKNKNDPDLIYEIKGKESEAFPKFLQGYQKCTSIAAQRPRSILMLNQTNQYLRDKAGWFGSISPFMHSDLSPVSRPAVLSNGFTDYHLNSGQSIEFIELGEKEQFWNRLPLPVPDYSQVENLLRVYPELVASDFSSSFFLYSDRIESAAVITRDTRVTRPLHGISIYNLADKYISRVQVNGWELTEFMGEVWNIPCGFSRTGQIPTLQAPVQIRWQFAGEDKWLHKDIATIPSIPDPGVITDEVWYEIYLDDSPHMRILLYGLEPWADGEIGYSDKMWESSPPRNITCNPL
jgi:hypothetical protein